MDEGKILVKGDYDKVVETHPEVFKEALE